MYDNLDTYITLRGCVKGSTNIIEANMYCRQLVNLMALYMYVPFNV